MTPRGRLPPPVPAPSPAVPQPDELYEFEEEGPTVVDRPRCPTCPSQGSDYVRLEDDVQPPASYAEAFHDRRYGSRCRGTTWWGWCKSVQQHEGPGRLLVPGRGLIAIFLDRRVRVEPVELERRKATAGSPKSR